MLIVSLIEKATGTKIQEYEGHKVDSFGVDVVFNSKDTHILTGSADGKLHIYDILKSQPIKSIQAHKQVLSAIGMHESGGMITAGHDGSLSYWQI